MPIPDFSESTKRIASDRVGGHCTLCDTPTRGPNEDPTKATILGEAAHIRGKKPGAPRYDAGMTDAERANIDNALWACRNCHGRFDKDYLHYSVADLRRHRDEAEARARQRQCRLTDSPAQTLFKSIPQKWCHETTNDDSYVRRSAKVNQLNAWFNNPSIRAITLVGIGGAGKTALAGHWLKVDNQDLVRDVRGLFYWSFYVERDVDQFLTGLISFIEDLDTNVELAADLKDPLDSLERNFTKLPPLVLLLDGLEVLQHAVSEGRAYGAFIDAKLRDFIQLISYAKKPWLCISTSRFPITDLDHTPNAKCLQLLNLEPEESAEVLNHNGVLGTEDDRKKVAHYLNGHPLALRIFAASIPRSIRTIPCQHLHDVFGESDIDNPFLDKLFRLLGFYAETLATSQSTIIQALSLFRSPVPQRTLAIIAPVLKGTWKNDSESLNLALTTELGRLVGSGLAIRDRRGTEDIYACHPIVRDYFRQDLLSQRDASRAAIDILTSRPDDLGIQGVSNLEPLLLTCEALLISGDVRSVIELYVTRFQKGGAFLAGGLPKEGKRLFDALERFSTEHPDALSSAQNFSIFNGIDRHTNYDSIHFRNGAILFDILLGELSDAEQLIKVQLNEATGSRRATIYNHQALLEFYRGDYANVSKVAKSVFQVTTQANIVSSTALIQAQAHYLRLKSLVLLGLDKEARKVNKEIMEIHQLLDSEDGLILVDLAHLWLASRGNRDGCGQAAKRIRSMLPKLTEDHLALEAKLVAARWYILKRQPKGLAEQLISEVYRHAIEQSYPYPMISSQIMREYYTYSLGEQCSEHLLKQAATLAEANQMYGLQAEALWVQSLMEDDPEIRTAILQKIDLLNNKLCYTTLPKTYPEVS